MQKGLDGEAAAVMGLGFGRKTPWQNSLAVTCSRTPTHTNAHHYPGSCQYSLRTDLMQKGLDGVAAAVMGDADAAAKVIGVYSVDQINHIGLEQERCIPDLLCADLLCAPEWRSSASPLTSTGPHLQRNRECTRAFAAFYACACKFDVLLCARVSSCVGQVHVQCVHGTGGQG